jgi:hypothetical protein
MEYLAPEDVAAHDYAERIAALTKAILEHPDYDRGDAAHAMATMAFIFARDCGEDAKIAIARHMIDRARACSY